MKININHIFSVYIATVCDQIRYTSVSCMYECLLGMLDDKKY